MQSLSIIGCIGEAWDCFRKQPVLAVGGFMVYLAIAFMGSIIPIISIFFSLLVAPALMGGFMLLFLNLAGNGEPRLEDLFAGFSRYTHMMGLYWLMVTAAMIGLMPTIIYLFASSAIASFMAGMAAGPGGMVEPSIPWGLLIVYMLNLIGLSLLLVRYSFAWFIVMDDPKISIIDALKKSAFLMKGNFWRVVLLFVTLGVIGMASIFALIIGYFVAAPILMLAFARAYLNLMNIQFHTVRRTPPPPTPDPDPTPTPDQTAAPLPPQ